MDSHRGVDHLRKAVERLGAQFDDVVLEGTRSIYTEHLLPVSGIREHIDVRYGPHEKHRVDVFCGRGEKMPIVVFVPGGGFIGGDKRGDGGFYANVGRFFASRGYLAVTMNYRLATTHAWPAAFQDVGSVFEWIERYGPEYGGDPSHAGLIGHSAGACHAAGFLFDPGTGTQAARQVKAAALLSGFYRARAPLSPGQAAYFGNDETAYAARSPSMHAGTNPALPVLLAIAEYDPARLVQQTSEFAAALSAARGAPPPLHWFAGHNHVSTVMSLGTPQNDVGERLCEFLDSHLKVA